MSQTQTNRNAQAIAAIKDLLNAMEVEDAPIERCLMLAQRAARTMRDTDAQTWLNFEQQGYPENPNGIKLGTCAKYAYRFRKDGTIFATSLPGLEADKLSKSIALEKISVPSINKPAENYLVSGATQSVINSSVQILNYARQAYVQASSTYAKMRGALHRWAADTLISLEFGNVAENIFEKSRTNVDIFIRTHCPSSAEQLVMVDERMSERTKESYSMALTACRRLLASVADALFPPCSEPYTDGKGKKRNVGEDQYKNRLIAFIEQSIKSGSTANLVTSQIEHVAARVDAVYEKSCKGVHANVTEEEAQLVVIDTYLLIAELARYKLPTPAAPQAQEPA